MGNQQKRKFGLLTTVAMIAGIVIGSGIFFKTDNILIAVNGNVLLGVLTWILGAVGIIFGGLTMAQFAKVDENVGGIITYSEVSWGKTLGYLAGWFQIMFYYPALVAIIAWVAGMYTCTLFGLPGPFSVYTWGLTMFYLLGLFALNAFATKAAGHFQSITLIIKITALIILGLTGLFFGNPGATLNLSAGIGSGNGLFVALIAVAFAFDGWLVAPSIAHEIKNPKRNLPLALTLAPILILVIYLAYFVGITSVLGSAKIIELGDSAVGEIANMFFGPLGIKIVYTCVVLSVLGTLNGLILGFIRLPYALALRNEMYQSEKLAKVHAKYDIPLASVVLSLVVSLVWLLLHFLSTNGVIYYKLTLFEGLDVSELPIVLTYFFYMSIYVSVIRNFVINRAKGLLNGLLIPSMAVIGASLVIYGGLTNPKFNVYLIVSLVGIVAGLLLKPKKSV